MDKERKQDLGGPDEEALEQRVRDMLDVNVPEVPEVAEPAATPEVEVPSTKIDVSEPDIPSAPPVVSPKKGSKKSISITHHDDEAVPSEVPAPKEALLEAIEETNKQLAEATAPLVPEAPAKPAKSKKVAITHFDDTKPSEPESISVEDTPTEIIAESEETTEEPELTAGEQEEPTPESSEPEIVDEEEPDSPLERTIESLETDRAVAEIIAAESDELLSMKDQEVRAIKPEKSKKPKKKRRSIFTLPFRSSAARWILFLLFVAASAAIVTVPAFRYSVLNAAGVRSSASVVVLDQSTEQPLKNVTATLAGQSVQTDSTGKAQFSQLRLGPTKLSLEKRAFAKVTRTETVGWGSNPLAETRLKPVGIQYSFIVTDTFSGKPLSSAEATLGDANANADSKGEIILTLDEKSDLKSKVTIKAPGYRDETRDLPGSTKEPVSVSLIPAHKVAFISKRSGTYDLYKIDADGKNEQLVLKGTGNEQDNITLAAHPSEDVVVLIASRDNKRGPDGALLSTLTFVNLKDGATKSVIQSPQIKAVDWVGTRFVYTQMVTGASAEDPQRSKLMSFDYVSGDNRQLATANYFNDIVSAAGKIYYAPAGAFQNGVNNGMFVVFADASGKQALFNQEVWSILRSGYDRLTMAVQQDWYELLLGGKPSKLSGQPSDTNTRVYVDSPDGKHSVWIDTRDGKGTILTYDVYTKQEKVLFARSGLKGPVRWLNSRTIVFRMDSADYVISIDAGTPKKLIDVSDTKGVDRWSY